MNNYLILNGVNSNTIQGLLIQSLPPITKPLIRTSVEEIDGRDGDIVTKLGFSAYDKEISIGLHGNYDVDEVISFFNSEGTVTFSNEPNKYYNYQILNQIDFEKLIRFKTATVVLHVQPFKYSLIDTERTFEITSQTSIDITNNGNYISKPIMTIYGTGTINLYVNASQVFIIALGNDEEYITIDAEIMEAFKDTTTVLKNRLVTGDYENFVLNVGENTISWTGTVTQIVISNYTRWL